MKKVLIVIAVLLAAFLIWKLVLKDKGSFFSHPQAAQPDSAPNKYGAPSATDSRTYSVDTKNSWIGIAGSSDKNSAKLSIKNGSIVLSKGAVVGGKTVFDLKGVKDFTGLNTDQYPEATLEVKAVVFDQLNSSVDNLVYRTDAELTMNGVTNPMSFVSTFDYSENTITIGGNAKPDWKLWGLSSVNSAISLNITLSATAK